MTAKRKKARRKKAPKKAAALRPAALVDPRTGRTKWVFASANPAKHAKQMSQPWWIASKAPPQVAGWLAELSKGQLVPELRTFDDHSLVGGLSPWATRKEVVEVGIEILQSEGEPIFNVPGAPGPGGTESTYDPALAELICQRLEDGESLRSILRSDPTVMPRRRAFYRWLDAHSELQHHYAQAREAGFDSIAEEGLAIADDGTRDTWTDDEGREHVNHDHIARARLRVETRFRWLGKVSARYHPKYTLAVEGGAPEKPVFVKHALTPLPPALEAQLRGHIRFALQGQATEGEE